MKMYNSVLVGAETLPFDKTEWKNMLGRLNTKRKTISSTKNQTILSEIVSLIDEFTAMHNLLQACSKFKPHTPVGKSALETSFMSGYKQARSHARLPLHRIIVSAAIKVEVSEHVNERCYTLAANLLDEETLRRSFPESSDVSDLCMEAVEVYLQSALDAHAKSTADLNTKSQQFGDVLQILVAGGIPPLVKMKVTALVNMCHLIPDDAGDLDAQLGQISQDKKLPIFRTLFSDKFGTSLFQHAEAASGTMKDTASAMKDIQSSIQTISALSERDVGKDFSGAVVAGSGQPLPTQGRGKVCRAKCTGSFWLDNFSLFNRVFF
jgi:hypothetical protein